VVGALGWLAGWQVGECSARRLAGSGGLCRSSRAWQPEGRQPRPVRPEDGGMSFKDFLKQGIVEWVDVNEDGVQTQL